jgi:two-component sensor histidine kinase
MPWVRRISKLSKGRDGLRAWAASLLLFAASLSVRVIFAPVLAGSAFMAFYPAVAASALIYGFRQGVVVLLLSAFSGWYLLSEQISSLGLSQFAAIGEAGGFLLVGGSILLLIAALREAVRRSESAKAAQDTLYRELQHRVANNLQLVVSLLRNAERNLRNPDAAADTLHDAEDRIIAMSRLHRRLNDGSAFASGLEPLLREVLADTFRDWPVTVQVTVKGASDLSIDQMTAITLLVNEAALNSVKHAFSKGRGAHFDVSLFKDVNGHLHLLVRDDGPGMGAQVATSEPRSLGMGIMEAFAKQLGGSLEVASNAGTSLSVEFGAH